MDLKTPTFDLFEIFFLFLFISKSRSIKVDVIGLNFELNISAFVDSLFLIKRN